MSEFFNRTYMQDILIVAFIIAIFVSALVAHTTIVWVAILSGIVAGILGGRFIFNKKWKAISTKDCPIWKRWLWLAIISIIGSQMGWVALLI